ncbi:MAG: MotA/TolQ/ExbB proton channel family protein [Kiritimatiellae bacterium]|nr:MotA/TolQ/ExbB proton channel family protein [Kiritimatiellia bacterium]
MHQRFLSLALCLSLACLVGLCIGTLSAQEPVGPMSAGEAPGPQQMSLLEIVEAGGRLMYMLGAMSVLALAFVIFFFMTLRSGQIAPRGLKEELISKMRGRQFEEVRMVCGFRPCPLSAVTLAAVDYAESVPRVETPVLKDIVEGEGARQASLIQGRTQYLLDIAVISPMVGLLGTVLGMLRAFNTVALDLAKVKPMYLAQGVSQALITTAAGLMVGIPAMVFYAYFRGRASRLVAYLETAAIEVLTSLMSREPE